MITHREVIRLSYSGHEYVMYIYSVGKAGKTRMCLPENLNCLQLKLRYNHVLKWCNIAVSFLFGHN